MGKIALVFILLASLLACRESVQNSEKQKDMTQGSSPPNSTTATEQQNYGAGDQAGKSESPQDPSHTQNLTTPAPGTPTPQAETQTSKSPKKETGKTSSPK